MHKLAKKYLIWVWISALLSATIGISVQQIYCYCVGKTTVALFRTEGVCPEEKQETLPQCCKQPEAAPAPSPSTSCCKTTPTPPPTHKPDSCTKKTTKVFQMKTEFLVEQLHLKVLDYPLWMSDTPFYKHVLKPVVCDSIKTNKAPPSPPPPLSGRTICVRHETFLC